MLVVKRVIAVLFWSPKNANNLAHYKQPMLEIKRGLDILNIRAVS